MEFINMHLSIYVVLIVSICTKENRLLFKQFEEYIVFTGVEIMFQ